MPEDLEITEAIRRGLHREVTALGLTSHTVEALIHALIDLGRITRLACEMPNCRFPGEGFLNNGRRAPRGLSIDHVTPRFEGGTHLPENLRLAHYSCNCAWNTGRKRPIVGLKTSMTFLLKRARALQSTIHEVNINELSNEERAEYLRMNALALHTELGEMLQLTNWKPWKPGEVLDFDREMVIEELVDVLFFWLNLAVLLDFSGSELVDAYMEKYGENELRATLRRLKQVLPIVRDDYHPRGRSGMCSVCGEGPFKKLGVHEGRSHPDQRPPEYEPRKQPSDTGRFHYPECPMRSADPDELAECVCDRLAEL